MLFSRRHGMTLQEIAAEAGVSIKTVRRDLSTFRDAGFPIEEAAGPHGRKTWSIRRDSRQPTLSFTFEEAMSLYLGRRFLEPLAGTIFWKSARDAFAKIRATLGTEVLGYVEKMADRFHQTLGGVGDYSEKDELLDCLMIGIEDARAIHITYQSQQATEPTTRDVYPLGFIYHRGSLYLVARTPSEDDIRHFKVDRIEAAELSDIRFQRPDDFDVSEHLAGSFGVYHGQEDVSVRVRFSPGVARFVQERTWHPSQQLDRQADGSLLASFRLSETEEIKHWIFSFGANAVVLEPASLREEIKEEIRQMQQSYSHHPFAESVNAV